MVAGRILVIKSFFWIGKKPIVYFLAKTKQNNKMYNLYTLRKTGATPESNDNFLRVRNRIRGIKNFYQKESIINKKICYVQSKKYTFLNKYMKTITLYFYVSSNFFFNNNIIKKQILNYNFLVKKGKKLVIFSIRHKLLCLVKNKLKVDVFLFLQLIIKKIMPFIFYRTRYSSGRKYKIPYIISTIKSYRLALKWFFLNARSRNEPTSLLCLFGELFDSYKLRSKTIKYKHFIYKLSKENRIFIYLFKKKRKWN